MLSYQNLEAFFFIKQVPMVRFFIKFQISENFESGIFC